MRRCILLLCLLFTGMATTYAQTDTIRWTWKVTSNYYSSYFYFWGTEGESFVVDWGDGITEEVISGFSGGSASLWGEYAAYDYVSHTYESMGTYTIVLYGKTQDARIEKFFPSSSWYNSLLSLDVSKNANLEKLTCSDNRLTELDVTKNPALTYLSCRYNQLTELDVTKNPALTYLDCGSNRLTELDVTKNVNLEKLYCSYNRLSLLRVAEYGSLNSVGMAHNKLPFHVVVDVWASLTEGATYSITPQPKEQTVLRGKALPLPELPLIADTRAHLDIWHKGELLKENQNYTIHNDSVYFEGVGNYKLVVWHDSVQERYEKYIDGKWTVENKIYGDTTYVTVYSEYEEGNDAVRVTGILEIPKNYHDQSISFRFVGTAGQSFILDWGDETKAVLESTGEEINCIHNYDNNEVRPISYMLYGVTQESRITRVDHHWNRYIIKEMTMDVSDCPELTYLDCSDNDLKTLDITKNAKLEYLDCSGNDLKVLDVSKNRELSYLDCSYSSDLMVDVSKNEKLTYLICWENNLKSLDISKNEKLEYLSCPWNRISKLDVSKNLKLKSLQCGANALTKLDVSKNVALEVLGLSMNALTKLDVSKNVALEEIWCPSNLLTSLDVSKNEKLTELACAWNRLTTLDISKNDSLKRLDCNDNRLESLDISNNVLLEELYCEDNLLTVLEMSENVELTNLRCENNRLEVLDVSKNVKLDRLECNNNRLTVLDVSQNENLGELECSNNRLTSLDLKGKLGWSWLECNDNFREVVLDEENGFDLVNLPDIDLDRIVDIEGGTLDGTYLKFGADELRYKYSVGSKYASYDTVWFRLVSDKHAEPQIPLTAEFFPDDIFREYLGDFDKDGNDSLCKHECAVVREVSFDCPDGSWDGYWSRGVKTLEGLQYFENLEKLYCYGNELTSLDVSKNLNLKTLDCSYNALTSLDVSKNLELESLGCEYNALTSLDISRNENLDYLSCSHNRLPLSEIVNIKINVSSNKYYYYYDIASYTPQYIPVTLKPGKVLDLSSEMVLNGVATEVDFGDIAESEYTFTNGELKFEKAGQYQVRLTNDTVRNIHYDGDNREIYYGDIVEVYYDITVKDEGGDDPDDPDNPDNPDNPTANEDEASSVVNVYVRNHTIYLSENLGEMRVFTVMGQCIHRGNGQSAEVPCAGLYIVQAGGRVWKVVVK